MTDQEIETIANKIGEVAPDQVANFLANPEGFDYDILEQNYSDFTDKYKNVADFKGDKYKIMNEIYTQLEGNAPSYARFLSLQQKYPWLDAAELKDWFDKVSGFKKEFEAEREAEAGRIKREQEIQNRGMDDPRYWLASEYENQRYINDPESAIFGEQAPGFLGSSTGAKADLISGILGAAGDLAPGVGAVVGPTIRAGRDWTHILTDSPYKKDVTQAVKDQMLDYGTNIAAWRMLNARKLGKAVEGGVSSEVSNALNVAEETARLRKGFMDVERALADNATDTQLRNAVKNMPDSELKNKLTNIVSSTNTDKPINRQAIKELNERYFLESTNMIQNIQRANIAAGYPAGTSEGLVTDIRINGKPTTMVINPEMSQNVARQFSEPGNSYFARVLDTKRYEDLSRLQKAQYKLKQATNAIVKGKPGQIMVQETSHIRNKGSEAKYVENALLKKEREDSIDRIISNYSILWNKDKKPAEAFKGSLIEAAWEKWRNQ